MYCFAVQTHSVAYDRFHLRKSFEHICFFVAVALSLLDFQIFHVDISKQFTVILKTFLQITSSWQLSSEQEIQSLVVIT